MLDGAELPVSPLHSKGVTPGREGRNLVAVPSSVTKGERREVEGGLGRENFSFSSLPLSHLSASRPKTSEISLGCP